MLLQKPKNVSVGLRNFCIADIFFCLIAVGKDLTNEFETQIKQAKKQEKSNRFLSRERLDSSNILIEKWRK